MSHYKPYPAYKDSGVERIGVVPAHWEVKRLRHVAPFANSGVDKKSYEDQQSVKLCNYTDVYYNEFITDLLPFMDATASEAEIERFTLKQGDVLLTKDSEDPSDIGIPAFVAQNMPGVVCGYHLTVIRAGNRNLGGYIHRSIQSHPTKAHFFVESPGITRYGLSQDAIGDIVVCLPPARERQAIAVALDHATARIDTLVAKKTRFIELLREKRQALITHTVTKGLDPNVKMKDSGVEWLGEMPEHWGVGVVSRVATRTVVGIAEAATHAYADSGTPILRSTNIRPYRIGGEILYVNADFADDRDTKLIHAGDLVTVRTGNAGVTAVVPPELDGCQCFTMLITTLKDGMQSDYYCYWMNSAAAVHYFRIEGWGTAQVNISVPILKSLPVPIPPEQEQKEIVAFLLRETQRLDMLLVKTERSIELLKERRSALITAAVTGQIDLREAV